jgi:hypothetical protein
MRYLETPFAHSTSTLSYLEVRITPLQLRTLVTLSRRPWDIMTYSSLTKPSISSSLDASASNFFGAISLASCYLSNRKPSSSESLASDEEFLSG